MHKETSERNFVFFFSAFRVHEINTMLTKEQLSGEQCVIFISISLLQTGFFCLLLLRVKKKDDE